jgi:hypothetical protein
MVKLNLPEFEYNVKKAEGKVWIFDIIRKRFIVLTPEEWVRQHFVNYIITELKYPRALIKIETGLVYNKLSKRSDIIVHNRQGQPWMIIECKAPELKLSQQTLQQVTMYNASIRANYIVVTNGLVHLCCEVNWADRVTTLLKAFPDYEDLV